jgi:hypothetical protein
VLVAVVVGLEIPSLLAALLSVVLQLTFLTGRRISLLNHAVLLPFVSTSDKGIIMLTSRTIANALTNGRKSDELVEKGMIAALFIALQLGSFEMKVELVSAFANAVQISNEVAAVEITEKGGLEILAEGLGIDENIICSSLQPLFENCEAGS